MDVDIFSFHQTVVVCNFSLITWRIENMVGKKNPKNADYLKVLCSMYYLWFDLWSVLYWLSILFIFISMCVDESKLCQGLPFCGNNQNDLKYCNATLWNQTSTTKWTPLWVNFLSKALTLLSFNPTYKRDLLGIPGARLFLVNVMFKIRKKINICVKCNWKWLAGCRAGICVQGKSRVHNILLQHYRTI